MNSESKTFEENKPKEPAYDPLNQCKRCGIRAGKYIEKATGEKVGVFLLQDKRGFKMCNLCRDAGFLIPERKMNKSERRAFKKLKRNIAQGIGLEHITLDAEGKEVK